MSSTEIQEFTQLSFIADDEVINTILKQFNMRGVQLFYFNQMKLRNGNVVRVIPHMFTKDTAINQQNVEAVSVVKDILTKHSIQFKERTVLSVCTLYDLQQLYSMLADKVDINASGIDKHGHTILDLSDVKYAKEIISRQQAKEFSFEDCNFRIKPNFKINPAKCSIPVSLGKFNPEIKINTKGKQEEDEDDDWN